MSQDFKDSKPHKHFHIDNLDIKGEPKPKRIAMKLSNPECRNGKCHLDFKDYKPMITMIAM